MITPVLAQQVATSALSSTDLAAIKTALTTVIPTPATGKNWDEVAGVQIVVSPSGTAVLTLRFNN